MFRMTLLVLTLSSTAMAAPLVTKITTTGSDVKPEFTKIQKCELMETEVIITQTYGMANGSTASVTRSVPVMLDSGFKAMLAATAQDRLETSDNSECGGPATAVVTDNGTVLYATGGCGKPRQSRYGGPTSNVLDLINSFCPRTF